MKSLKPRLLTAAIGIPAIVLLIFFSEMWHPLMNLAVGLTASFMVGEYLYGNQLLKVWPLSIVCIVFGFAFSALITTPYVYLIVFAFLLAAFIVGIVLHETVDYGKLSYAMLGTLVISFGMSAVSYACYGSLSLTFYFIAMFLLPWMADAGGFFIGSALGKHKLCPKISPKKTVEGAIGGILFCMIAAVVMGLVFDFFVFKDININYFSLILLGFLDAIFSIVGDLSFSLIKRHLGIKDYGTIFPGHGGFLDRCDSIIFTAPLVVVIGQFMPFLSLG